MTDEDDLLHKAHDRFTRNFLSEAQQARELVQWGLPAAVIAELDLASMQPAKESFIRQTLHEGLSDLVFNIKLKRGDDASVVFLFEHKSSTDGNTVFQILRYIVGINEHRQRDGLPLCCVIPLVLYHGVQEWNVARTLPDLIAPPSSLRCYVPDFVMPLLDLSRCSDDELRGESVFLAYMCLLKYIKRDELPEQLPGILGLFRKLLPPATALESFEAILRYLATGTDRVTRDELRSIVIEAIQTEGESIMPTIAEEWKKEGRQEGALIGRIRTLQELMGKPVAEESVLEKLPLSELQVLAEQLGQESKGNR